MRRARNSSKMIGLTPEKDRRVPCANYETFFALSIHFVCGNSRPLGFARGGCLGARKGARRQCCPPKRRTEVQGREPAHSRSRGGPPFPDDPGGEGRTTEMGLAAESGRRRSHWNVQRRIDAKNAGRRVGRGVATHPAQGCHPAQCCATLPTREDAAGDSGNLSQRGAPRLYGIR